ncbi:uncharacterized protein [Oscarella lobularis]|uniref:uncharacterized protein isoform X2 n=1 Tax=Oscarella lobularis TaxID=121494 RepID=UPI0033134F8E
MQRFFFRCFISRPSSLNRPRNRTPSLRNLRPDESVILKRSEHSPSAHKSTKDALYSSFKDFDLRSDVVDALKYLNLTRPTLIQMLAIPKILRGENVLCAAETGSGKTLAYLAPIVNRLRDEEEFAGKVTRINRPRAVILLPARELVSQVLSVAKSLCHVARFRAVGLCGGRRKKWMIQSLESPFDIAIATPDSLNKLSGLGHIYLSEVSHLVIDEVDTMLDRGFRNQVLDIMSRSQGPKRAAQVVLVGATLPSQVEGEIKKRVPNLVQAMSKNLHKVLPHVEQRFLKVKPEDKAAKLVALLRHKPKERAIVFCNTIRSCDWTAKFLAENGIFPIKLHGSINPEDRIERHKLFQEGRSNVLVCTDIASRGLDMSLVSHVVLFDFPETTVDYIHRVGRTGRVGGPLHCTVTSLVCREREQKVAKLIVDAAKRNEAIGAVQKRHETNL